MTPAKIIDLLGEDGLSLLGHQCATIDKSMHHLPALTRTQRLVGSRMHEVQSPTRGSWYAPTDPGQEPQRSLLTRSDVLRTL